MRFILPFMLLLLSGCSAYSNTISSRNTVQQFYTQYMTIYTGENHESLSNYTDPVYNKYVASGLTERLRQVDGYYEQDIIGADYFMYVQDFSPEWIATLRIGTARPYLGGESVEVWLGDPANNLMHLMVYTRKEEGRWKIYRVRDVTHAFEHAIYDAGTLARARAWSVKIAPEYEKD